MPFVRLPTRYGITASTIIQHSGDLNPFFGYYNVDWVHSDLGTFGTRGGKLAAAQPYALSRSRGLKRWSCYIGICDSVALLPEDPRACPACAA
jgi:hypothetical protein